MINNTQLLYSQNSLLHRHWAQN